MATEPMTPKCEILFRQTMRSGHEELLFVEVEDAEGKSFCLGETVSRDNYVRIVFDDPRALRAEVERLKATHASEMRRAFRAGSDRAYIMASDTCYGVSNSWSEADMHAIPHASMKARVAENLADDIIELHAQDIPDASIDAALASGDVQEGT